MFRTAVISCIATWVLISCTTSPDIPLQEPEELKVEASVTEPGISIPEAAVIEPAPSEVSASENPTVEEGTTAKIVAEEPVSGKTVATKTTPAKAVTEKPAPEKTITTKTTPAKAVTEKPAPEKSVTTKTTPAKAVTEKPAPGKTISTKTAPAKAIDEKPVVEAPVASEPVVVLPRISGFTVSKRSVATGELLNVSFVAENAERIAVDFGMGKTETHSYAYTSFGAKTISVIAVNAEGIAHAEKTVAVKGIFVPQVPMLTVSHNALWKPVTTGRIIGMGTYDEVQGFIEGQQVFSVPSASLYEIPVPFVGSRKIDLQLFERDLPVSRPVTITMTGTNEPPSKPSFDGPALLNAKAGESISFRVLSSDPNDDPLRFDALPLPDGALIDPETGLFSWTPTAGQVGYHLINFHVFDRPYDTHNGFAQRTILVVQ